MDSIEKNIGLAWKLRVNQKVEECVGLVSVLKKELGLSAGVPSDEQIHQLSKQLPEPIVIDILLLSASLARILGNFEESKLRMAQVERVAEEFGVIGHVRLYLERGLLAFLYGNFSTALEDF